MANLDIQAGKAINHQGSIIANAATVSVNEWDNTEGLVQFQTLNIVADKLHNQAGQVTLYDEDVESFIDVQGAIDNRQGLIYSAGERLTVSAHSLDNNQGDLVLADGLLVLTIGDTLKNSGQIQAESIRLQAGDLDNNRGVLLANTMTAAAGVIKNTGAIQADTLSLSGNRYWAEGGSLLSLSDADLFMQFTAIDNLNNSRIENQGNGALRLDAESIDNSDSQITAAVEIDINAKQLNNNNGFLFAEDFTLDVRSLDNRQGSIVAAKNLDVKTRQLNNADGLIYSDSNFSFSLTGTQGLNNRSGVIRSGQNLSLAISGDLYNQQGLLQADDTLTISADKISNKNGQLVADNIQLTANAIYNLDEGLIKSDFFQVNANVLNNQGSIVITNTGHNAVKLNVNDFINSGLLDVHTYDLKLTDLNYLTDGGEIYHRGLGELYISTNSHFDNRTGSLVTAGTLRLDAEHIDNRGGYLIAGNGLDINLLTFNNEGGSLQAGNAFSLTLESLNNRGGTIVAAGSSPSYLNVTGMLDNTEGAIYYDGLASLSVSAQSLDNTTGFLGGMGNLDITALDSLNNTDGLIVSAGAVTIASRSIANIGESRIEAKNLNLVADTLENQGMVLATDAVAEESLTFSVGEIHNAGLIESLGVNFDFTDSVLNNQGGQVVHRGLGALRIEQTEFNQQDANLFSFGRVTINADTINQINSNLVAAKGLQLTAASVNQQNASMQASESVQWQSHSLSQDAESSIVFLAESDAHLELFDIQNAGIISSAGNLFLNADNIINAPEGIVEADSLVLEASVMNNAGQISAAQSVMQVGFLSNQALARMDFGLSEIGFNEFINNGLLLTYDDSTSGSSLIGDEFINTGLVEDQAGQLSIVATALQNQGHIIAANNANLFVSEIDNQEGTIHADASLHITSTKFDNAQGLLHAQELQLHADEVINSSGIMVADGITVTVNSLDNTEGTIVGTSNSGSFMLDVAGLVDNSLGLIQSDNNSAHIQAVRIQNTGGDILYRGEGTLEVDVESLLNAEQGSLVSFGDLAVTTQLLENHNANIQAMGNIDLQSSKIINTGGLIAADNHAHIVSDEIHNTNLNDNTGQLYGQWLTIDFDALANSGRVDGSSVTLTGITADNTGEIISYGSDDHTLEIIAEHLSNTLGEISGQWVTLQVTTIENMGGKLIGNSLDITADTLHNANHYTLDEDETVIAYLSGQEVLLNTTLLDNSGVIQGEQVKVEGDHLDNNVGIMLATGAEGESLQLAVNQITNELGLLESAGELLTFTGILDNRQGNITLTSDGLLQLTEVINDDKGHIFSLGDIAIQHTGDFSNQGGVVQAQGALNIEVDNLLNQDGKLLSADVLSINAQTLDNRDKGFILARSQADNSLQLNITEFLDNRYGYIESHANNLMLTMADTRNDSGEIYHLGEGVLTINADGDQSTGAGVIASTGSIAVNATGTFTNEGEISANQALDFSAASFSNLLGALLNAESLSIDAQTTVNAGNMQAERLWLGEGEFTNLATETTPDEWSGGRVVLTGSTADSLIFDNTRFNNLTGAVLQLAADSLQIDAEFNNHGGTLISTGENILSFSQLDNTDGHLFTLGDLEINQHQFINNGGRLRTDGSLVITAESINNQAGDIQALGALSLQAESLDNTSGSLIAQDAFTINIGDLLDNTQGKLISEADIMWLSAGALNNTLGYIEHHGAQALMLENIASLNNNGGQINSAGSLTLDVMNIFNNAIDDNIALINAADLTLTASSRSEEHTSE